MPGKVSLSLSLSLSSSTSPSTTESSTCTSLSSVSSSHYVSLHLHNSEQPEPLVQQTQVLQRSPRFLFADEHMHFTFSNPPGHIVTLGNLHINITQPPSTSVFSIFPIPSDLDI
ncbi:unnamed protein product [Ectocarpus sp. 12 AP-2014]